MLRIFNEIKKFLREPKNIVLLLLGPIFFTIFIGGVYLKDYMKDIPIVVLDMDNSSVSRMIVNEFANHERYYISHEVNSLDELKNVIDSQNAYMGVYIPKNFYKDIKKQKSSNVAIIIDGSNATIGNTALAPASEILATLNAGINIKILEGKGLTPYTSYKLAKIFNFESRTLYDPKLTYKGYIMPGMVLVFVQQLFLSVFVPKIIEDRENIIIKALIYASTSVLSYIICIMVLNKFLNIEFKGSIVFPAIYVYLFILSLVGPSMVIASLFRDRLKVTQFCMVLSMPTFISAGYVWPTSQIPRSLLYTIKSTWPLIYTVSPVRDLLIKDTFIVVFKKEIISLCIFAGVWFLLGYILFKYTFGGSENEQERTA